MKQYALSVVFVFASIGIASNARAQDDGPVAYVKVCSLYGAGFYYIPGTNICRNPNGDTREERQDVNGNTRVWRTLWPYPQGNWTSLVHAECLLGRLVKLGTFKSTDFTLNDWNKKQTQPVTVVPKTGEFISKVIMSGGFYDPRLPGGRTGVNLGPGYCVRSQDPTVTEAMANGPYNPPWGDAGLPIGCVANSTIVNMPSAYSVPATAAYPQVDTFFPTADPTIVSGPYTFGRQLVVVTDINIEGQDTADRTLPMGAPLLVYTQANPDGSLSYGPLAGTLSVWVCLDHGSPSGGPLDNF